MADDLKIIARKLDQPIRGDLTQMQGSWVGATSIDVGNSQSYTVPEGASYIELHAVVDLWYKKSAGGDNAAVDTDEWLAAGNTRSVPAEPGEIIKCIAEA